MYLDESGSSAGIPYRISLIPTEESHFGHLANLLPIFKSFTAIGTLKIPISKHIDLIDISTSTHWALAISYISHYFSSPESLNPFLDLFNICQTLPNFFGFFWHAV